MRTENSPIRNKVTFGRGKKKGSEICHLNCFVEKIVDSNIEILDMIQTCTGREQGIQNTRLHVQDEKWRLESENLD